jgi:hypothetical protein
MIQGQTRTFSFDLKNDPSGKSLEIPNAIGIEFQPAGTELSFELDPIWIGD